MVSVQGKSHPAAVAGWPGQTKEHAGVVLRTVAALDDADIPYVLIGGLASSLLGRPRATEDIDLLVRAEQADAALDVLGDAGFETERTNPDWIYKAWLDGTTLDLIFWLKGGITLDDEMIARAGTSKIDGGLVRVVPPEDLLVIKAIVHDEQSPRHWHDALGVVAASSLDWPYLVRRARHGARRVLSLLLYAQADDLVVPDEAIRSLYREVYESK
jgi:predicted nucleotidyltransferase